MNCTKPVYLEHENMYVPCGRCVMCKVSLTREWATRILHEANSHEHSIFVTLTFNDEHINSTKSLSKIDLQLFFKRLRKHLFHRIKYYACGEYGDVNGRPHYHAIIFGLSERDRPWIEKSWPYGFVHIGTVTYESARYVAEYVQKKFTPKFAAQVYSGKQQPFMLCSKGIGEKFLKDYESRIRFDLGISIRGHDVGLPRYYKKKLELTEEEKKVIHDESAKRVLDRLSGDGKSNDMIFQEVVNARNQRQRNVVAKSVLHSRKGPF